VAAAIGSLIILAGIACQITQLVVSIRTRESRRDVTGDPWGGRMLEWSTASPPPPWNFAKLPQVSTTDAWWNSKSSMRGTQDRRTAAGSDEAIEMPKNTATGFVTEFFAVVTGFALIWDIWWMAGLGAIGALVTMLAFAFRDQEEVEIPADQIARFELTHMTETMS
jgi:cytochrome o ubiquinol oxidase subunit 1